MKEIHLINENYNYQITALEQTVNMKKMISQNSSMFKMLGFEETNYDEQSMNKLEEILDKYKEMAEKKQKFTEEKEKELWKEACGLMKKIK